MKKITDLFEERWRTVHERDGSGRLQKSRVRYKAKRQVRTVTNGPRIGHALIDFFCFEGPGLLIQSLVISAMSGPESYRWLELVDVLLDYWYFLMVPYLYTVFEFKWQRTPGKFITKTRVVDEYGNPPELFAVMLRTVIRMVPFEAFSCYGDPYSRGWHDKWSNTFVVPYAELLELKRLQEEQF